MTDRIRVLTVILDKDYREPDDADIMNAIRRIRGVRKVEPTVVTSDDHNARMIVGSEIAANLSDIARLAWDGKGPLFEGVKKDGE